MNTVHGKVEKGLALFIALERLFCGIMQSICTKRIIHIGQSRHDCDRRTFDMNHMYMSTEYIHSQYTLLIAKVTFDSHQSNIT